MHALSGGSPVLDVYKKSVVEQRFFHEFAFDNKALKHSTNFESVENVRSSNVVEFEFELHHIPNRYLSNYRYCAYNTFLLTTVTYKSVTTFIV